MRTQKKIKMKHKASSCTTIFRLHLLSVVKTEGTMKPVN